MSDLTAEHWATETLAKLHAMEASCSDTDLFCVGYLIPQVELVEVEFGQEPGTAEQWQARYQEYVERCLQSDRMGDDDVSRIREIVREL